jgi:hypothetical protein
MVRDMALLEKTQAEFSSDIDLVVSQVDSRDLGALASRYDATQNRFGGYRLRVGGSRGWHVDLWRLEDTWAFREKLVRPATPRALLETVFFSWDAAAYSLNEGRLMVSDTYFRELAIRKLGIVLRKVASPEKSAIRALRYWLRYEARISQPLAIFLQEHAFQRSTSELARLLQRAPKTIESLRERVEFPPEDDGFRSAPRRSGTPFQLRLPLSEPQHVDAELAGTKSSQTAPTSK